MKLKLIFLLCLLSFVRLNSQSTTDSTKITVYIFFSETCPICQSYTLTLKNLHEKYKQQNIEFVGVFSNYYTTDDSVQAFKKKYSIPFSLILDNNGEIAKKYNATITPEVFVEQNNVIIYSGRIDDTFYRIGKRRKVITSNDLDDALLSLVTNQKIKTPKTQAVGCIISLSK